MRHTFVLTEALRRYWHPLAWSREITDRPLPFKLLDQPLVLWRSEGRIAAFYDLCIHRGTPLSLGWVDRGELVCAYHGWRYGADGACMRIPSLPPDREIPGRARATVFRVQERYGLIWVCLGKPAVDIPEFPPEFTDSTYRWDQYSSAGQWQANAARMMENLADFSHFPWVHPGILGNRDQPECQPVSIEPIKGGFRYEIDMAVNRFKTESPAKQLYTLILPFTLIIQRRQPGSFERQTNIYLCTPISANETKFHRLAGRNYRDPLPDDELNRKHRRIFEQDRVIVESQRPEELPLDLSEELHLRGPDTVTVEYRRRLQGLCAEQGHT